MSNLKKDTFTRSDIEKSLIKDFPDINNSQIRQILNIFLEIIIESIALDKKIEIRGFGTFSKKNIRPRKFINPKTKKLSYLGETSTMHFKPSKSLIEK